MAAETQYSGNTGIGQATTANANLDGSGALATVITGADNGTLVRTVTITALGDTSEGMVRIFVYNGANSRLLMEVHIPANDATATNPAFSYTWKCDFKLEAGFELRASTQTGDDFNVIAEGLDWEYFTTEVRPESTQYSANTGSVLIDTANPNRDGTGTVVTVLTAGTAPMRGCRIDSVTIQALETVTEGTVRLFLYDGSSATRLLKEIFIPETVQSGTQPAFKITVNLDFNMEAGWSLKASTENSEDFAVIAEGNDWTYPSANQITNYTPASGTATTSEELMHSLEVPANLFASGGLMNVYVNAAFTSSVNSKTYRIYANTSNTLSGATLLATAAVTTAQTGAGISRLFPIISDTALECFGGPTTSTPSQYGQTTGTSANVTIPSISAGLWILISTQKANSGETITVRWSMVQKEF